MPRINRRQVLLGTLAAPLARGVRAQTSTIGVGMIGAGNRGAHVMLRVMEAPGTRIAALCDIKPDRLDAAASAAAAHSPKTYNDYRELLNDREVDAVHISTPCNLHVEMAIAALQAGKHVYCEKPVGITPQSIAELVKVARASNKIFMVGQQLRASKRLKTVIPKIRDGLIGEVIMVKAQRHASSDLDHNASSADWFFDVKQSGDVIVEMSVHNLDMCNWVVGERPEKAAGFGGTLLWKNDPPGRTNMDGYSLTYEYPSGVKLSYTQVFFHPRGMPGGGQSCYVYGTKGGVDLDNATMYALERNTQPVRLWEEEPDNLDIAHVTAFYDAVRSGKQPEAGIMVGATGALTAILGREAIYQKRVMTWSDLHVNL